LENRDGLLKSLKDNVFALFLGTSRISLANGIDMSDLFSLVWTVESYRRITTNDSSYTTPGSPLFAFEVYLDALSESK
jgi:hypothetical protein